MNVDNLPFQLAVAIIQRMTIFVAHVSDELVICTNVYDVTKSSLSFPEAALLLVSTKNCGSYVVSQDIYWFETIYGKCLHKRTNQRSNHYIHRGVTSNTTYLGELRPKGSGPLGTGMRKAKKAVRLLTITCDVVVVIGVKQRGIRIVIRRRKVIFGHPESEKRYVYIAIYCLP